MPSQVATHDGSDHQFREKIEARRCTAPWLLSCLLSLVGFLNAFTHCTHRVQDSPYLACRSLDVVIRSGEQSERDLKVLLLADCEGWSDGMCIHSLQAGPMLTCAIWSFVPYYTLGAR